MSDDGGKSGPVYRTAFVKDLRELFVKLFFGVLAGVLLYALIPSLTSLMHAVFLGILGIFLLAYLIRGGSRTHAGEK